MRTGGKRPGRGTGMVLPGTWGPKRHAHCISCLFSFCFCVLIKLRHFRDSDPSFSVEEVGDIYDMFSPRTSQ